MPDGILPVTLACHDMKVSEVKLEFVIDTMIDLGVTSNSDTYQVQNLGQVIHPLTF